jgi:hypothetical protein
MVEPRNRGINVSSSYCWPFRATYPARALAIVAMTGITTLATASRRPFASAKRLAGQPSARAAADRILRLFSALRAGSL